LSKPWRGDHPIRSMRSRCSRSLSPRQAASWMASASPRGKACTARAVETRSTSSSSPGRPQPARAVARLTLQTSLPGPACRPRSPARSAASSARLRRRRRPS
jgi:hypothetical protein